MFLFKLNPVGFYLLLVQQVFYVYCQCHILITFRTLLQSSVMLQEPIPCVIFYIFPYFFYILFFNTAKKLIDQIQ